MPIITAINPRKKKPRKSGKKKGAPQMAKKKRRAPRKTKTIVKYRTRKNPKRAIKRAGSYAKQQILGVNVTGALKSTIPLLLGALACKFAAKKFTDGGADDENWTWKNYAFGLLGGMVAAFGAQALFKTRSGTTQKILEGAFLLTVYKIFVNEIATSNSTMDEWFGEDDALPDYDGLGAEDMGPSAFLPPGTSGVMGDIWQGDDQDFVQGPDGAWRPIDEGHREPMNVTGLGDDDMLRPVTPQMGADFGDDMLRPVTPQMGDFDPETRMYSEF